MTLNTIIDILHYFITEGTETLAFRFFQPLAQVSSFWAMPGFLKIIRKYSPGSTMDLIICRMFVIINHQRSDYWDTVALIEYESINNFCRMVNINIFHKSFKALASIFKRNQFMWIFQWFIIIFFMINFHPFFKQLKMKNFLKMKKVQILFFRRRAQSGEVYTISKWKDTLTHTLTWPRLSERLCKMRILQIKFQENVNM